MRSSRSRRSAWTTSAKGSVCLFSPTTSSRGFVFGCDLVVSTQFPITAIREIKILKKLHHQNVIKLKEIVTSPGAYNHK